MSASTIEWEEVSDIFRQFCLFVSEPEMRWFRKAWHGFIQAGKASYENDVERHWALARAVTIGVMFVEFAGRAWEEHHDVEPILFELTAYEDTFNLIRLGNMADMDCLSDEGDESELFVEALANLVYRCRREVYDTLLTVFGNPVTLFISLWLSPDANAKVSDYSDDVFEDVVNHDRTLQKLGAYEFVANGMCG